MVYHHHFQNNTLNYVYTSITTPPTHNAPLDPC